MRIQQRRCGASSITAASERHNPAAWLWDSYSAGQQEAPHSPDIAVLCGGLRQYTAGQQGFCVCWQVATHETMAVLKLLQHSLLPVQIRRGSSSKLWSIGATVSGNSNPGLLAPHNPAPLVRSPACRQSSSRRHGWGCKLAPAIGWATGKCTTADPTESPCFQERQTEALHQNGAGADKLW